MDWVGLNLHRQKEGGCSWHRCVFVQSSSQCHPQLLFSSAFMLDRAQKGAQLGCHVGSCSLSHISVRCPVPAMIDLSESSHVREKVFEMQRPPTQTFI